MLCCGSHNLPAIVSSCQSQSTTLSHSITCCVCVRDTMLGTAVSYESFDWNSPLTPLNSFEFALSTSLIYALFCLVHAQLFTSKIATNKVDFDAIDKSEKGIGMMLIEKFLPIHNLILCVGSLIMLLGTMYEVYRRGSVEGYYWLLCEESGKSAVGPLFFWGYVYYLSKFYELLDTLLQIVQGKKPPHYFLHAYHHSCVIMMCWCWMQYCPTLIFIGVMFNTFVHVVMYYYFYLRSVGVRVIWWKKYVTIVQIVQFMTSGVCFLVTMFLIHIKGETCNGNAYLYICIAFNMSLLFGFVNVLSSNSKHDGKKNH